MYETETSDSKRTRAVGVEQQQINLGSEHISFQTSSSSTTTLAYQKRLISSPCWQKAKLNQNKGLILNKTQKKQLTNWTGYKSTVAPAKESEQEKLGGPEE